MVNAPRAQRARRGVVDARLITGRLQVSVLVRGMPRLADMNHILLADVEPVNRKPECRVVTTAKPQVVKKPSARGFGVVEISRCCRNLRPYEASFASVERRYAICLTAGKVFVV